jgi:hypothetical protein
LGGLGLRRLGLGRLRVGPLGSLLLDRRLRGRPADPLWHHRLHRLDGAKRRQPLIGVGIRTAAEGIQPGKARLWTAPLVEWLTIVAEPVLT